MFYINYLYTLLLAILLVGMPGPIQKTPETNATGEMVALSAGQSFRDTIRADFESEVALPTSNAVYSQLQALKKLEIKVSDRIQKFDESMSEFDARDSKVSDNKGTELAEAVSIARGQLAHKVFDQVQAKAPAKTKTLDQLWAIDQESTDSLFQDQLSVLTKQVVDSLLTVQVQVLADEKEGLRIVVSHQVRSYPPGSRHTLSVKLVNQTDEAVLVTPQITLPNNWQEQTNAATLAIPARSRQWLFVSFTIPERQSPGKQTGAISLLASDSTVLATTAIVFEVEKYHKLAVRTLEAPESAEAGESLEMRFEITNLGNVEAVVELTPVGKIEGETTRTIPVGETTVVKMTHETSEKMRLARLIGNRLRVKNTSSGKTISGYASTRVFPTKTFKKDAYFRYKMEASIYHNTYATKDTRFSSQFIELRGSGFLDVDDSHYLNLLVRAPNQSQLSRFGINDQYSLIYRYQDKTEVFLGDHTFNLSKLGFTGRYGMGAMINQSYKNWVFTGFFSKPRHFNLSKKPIFGGKVLLNPTEKLQVGLSVTSSQELARYYNTQNAKPEGIGGQVAVLEGKYESEKTLITSEVATSISGGKADFATDFTFNQHLGNFSYMGTFTSAGLNYFGTINNSLRYSNALNFAKGKWTTSVGQNYSKVNERVDTTFLGIQPYYQNLYARVGYRFNLRHFASARAYDRNREDLSERKTYKYHEKGVEYRYQFNGNKLTMNFNGRVARTSNLFQDGANARLTYANFISAGYRVLPSLSLRGSFSHNRTNRYSKVNSLVDYYQYGGGVNFRFNSSLQLRGTYNSGFSPEETFKKRDLVSVMLLARIGRRHQIEARANYYMRPEAVNEKELFAFVKYTFRFGVPLKKVRKLGSIRGQVSSADATIRLKGVRFMADGALVKTDAKGHFEINNIPEGKSQLILEKSSLPPGVVADSRKPFDLLIKEGAAAEVRIELARAQEVRGGLALKETDISAGLKGRIMLKGKRNKYYTTSKDDGSFTFRKIAPGEYTLSVVTLQDGDLVAKDTLNLSVGGEPIEDAVLPVSRKQRKIKFKSITTKLIEE
jgi:hypothetical protein